IGASLFPDDGDSAETLLKHADIAMYAAKDAGRDGYRLYQPPKRDSSVELAIASQLRQAERRDELELYYQPIVDLSQSCIVGAEAVRDRDHRVVRAAGRPGDDRADRGGRDDGHRRPRAAAGRDPLPGPAARDRRLRHRLLLPRPAAAAAAEHDQDRPLVREGP